MKNFNTVEEWEAFRFGTSCVKEYIKFCVAFFPNDDFSLNGISCFFHSLVDFARGRKTYIPNSHNNISFKEFCETIMTKL